MNAIFFWLMQDFLAVLTWGTMRVPELFLLSLVYRLLAEDHPDNVSFIWTAFAGGLLWDLRWVGIPGFFALSYVVVIMAVLWFWNAIPLSGRTRSLVFFLLWIAQLFPSLCAVLLGSPNAGWEFFWVQQGCAIPAALLGVFCYTVRMKEKNILNN